MKSLTKALVTRDIFTHDIKIKNLLRFLTLLSKRFLFVNQGNLLTKCSPRYVRFLKSLRVSRWNLCLKIINIYSSQYCDQKCLGVTWAIVCSTCFRRMSVRPKLLPSRFITIFYSPAKFIFGQNSWNEWSGFEPWTSGFRESARKGVGTKRLELQSGRRQQWLPTTTLKWRHIRPTQKSSAETKHCSFSQRYVKEIEQATDNNDWSQNWKLFLSKS